MNILGVKMQDKTALIIGGVVLVVAYSAYKKVADTLTDPAGFGANLGGGFVDLTAGIVSGVVTSIGQVIGIPNTDKTQCIKDIEAKNKWDASFSCDALTFIRSLGGTDQALSAGGSKLADSKVVAQPWFDPFGLLGK